MKNLLTVGIGGAIGSILRYKLGGYILHHFANIKFPLSTFSVNFIGCLIIGILSGYIEKHHNINPQIRLLLFVGILGGFTTFSAFGYDTLFLLRRGAILIAGLYIISTVFLGLMAVYFGAKLGRII